MEWRLGVQDLHCLRVRVVVYSKGTWYGARELSVWSDGDNEITNGYRLKGTKRTTHLASNLVSVT